MVKKRAVWWFDIFYFIFANRFIIHIQYFLFQWKFTGKSTSKVEVSTPVVEMKNNKSYENKLTWKRGDLFFVKQA